MWCPVCGHAVIPSEANFVSCVSGHDLEFNVYGALQRAVGPSPMVAAVGQTPESKAPAPDANVQPVEPAPIKTEIPPAPVVKPIGAKKGAK